MVESAQQLLTIIEQLQSFVDAQLARFDRVFDDCQVTLELESALNEQVAVIEVEKTYREQQRDEIVEQLRQESDQLAEAWTRLESKERQLLAREATLQSSGPQEFPTNGNEPTADPPSSDPLSRSENTVKPQSRQAAVQQFQQLSREISKHSRRND
ncbi:MAG: hypothetical protein IH991_14550 [Planctomycetes bacterium]|nr:hypothetical protein [Planctomycetota bacterium]